jgi:hypothetical protein
MLTRLIVDLYAGIIEIALWFMLVISGIAGYQYTVPLLDAAGWLIENETAWKVSGAIFFVGATFLVSAVLTGPFLVLVDIRRSIRALETKNSGSGSSVSVSSSRSSGGRDLPAEPREPSL